MKQHYSTLMSNNSLPSGICWLKVSGSLSLGVLLMMLIFLRLYISNGRWMNMSMGNSWNDSHREKPKYSKKYLFQCLSLHHKSHMDYAAIKPGFKSMMMVTTCLSWSTALSEVQLASFQCTEIFLCIVKKR